MITVPYTPENATVLILITMLCLDLFILSLRCLAVT